MGIVESPGPHRLFMTGLDDDDEIEMKSKKKRRKHQKKVKPETPAEENVVGVEEDEIRTYCPCF